VDKGCCIGPKAEIPQVPAILSAVLSHAPEPVDALASGSFPSHTACAIFSCVKGLPE
jgi:hypothetical protein